MTLMSFQNSQPPSPTLTAQMTAATIVDATTSASEVTMIWNASNASKASTAQ